jgi:hypothetical protein
MPLACVIWSTPVIACMEVLKPALATLSRLSRCGVSMKLS